MTVKLENMPDSEFVDKVAAPNLNKVATVRVVTTNRRIDRFWQMVKDETHNVFGAGTYSIEEEPDFKIAVVEIMKPKNSQFSPSDLDIFTAYRFSTKVVSDVDEAINLDALGKALPFHYEAPKANGAVGEAFV